MLSEVYMEIPIYLFTGFLESGKTRFIQETLEDENFNAGENTLLLVCEEGIEEYNPDKFSDKANIHIEYVENIKLLDTKKLVALEHQWKLDRVMIEHNGMNMVRDLMERLPQNWAIYQEVMFADATTFLNYNINMRGLMVDKLQGCELIVFNRCNPQIDKMKLHKIVRGSNRRTNIIYEQENGEIEYDQIQDPLPFDLNAPVIEIKDKDYAIWYRDIVEELTKYSGKTVCFKGIVAFNRSQPKNTFFLGRHVMTCCVEDITYMPFLCRWKEADKLHMRDWITVTASVEIQFNKRNGQKTPVFRIISVVPAQKPDQEVATFY